MNLVSFIVIRHREMSANKAFKTDSQHSAFSIQVSFVVTVQWFRLGGSVAHYLTRR